MGNHGHTCEQRSLLKVLSRRDGVSSRLLGYGSKPWNPACDI